METPHRAAAMGECMVDLLDLGAVQHSSQLGPAVKPLQVSAGINPGFPLEEPESREGSFDDLEALTHDGKFGRLAARGSG